MKCHVLHCDKPALVGMPPCYDHWLMWPAKVRARSPWVQLNSASDGRAYRESKPSESLLRSNDAPCGTNSHEPGQGRQDQRGRGQMALFT